MKTFSKTSQPGWDCTPDTGTARARKSGLKCSHALNHACHTRSPGARPILSGGLRVLNEIFLCSVGLPTYCRSPYVLWVSLSWGSPQFCVDRCPFGQCSFVITHETRVLFPHWERCQFHLFGIFSIWRKISNSGVNHNVTELKTLAPPIYVAETWTIRLSIYSAAAKRFLHASETAINSEINLHRFRNQDNFKKPSSAAKILRRN